MGTRLSRPYAHGLVCGERRDQRMVTPLAPEAGFWCPDRSCRDGAFPLQITPLGTSPGGRFVAIARGREPPYVLGVPPPAPPAGKRLPCRLGGTSGRRCFPRD